MAQIDGGAQPRADPRPSTTEVTNLFARRFPASPAEEELRTHYDAMRSALISVNIS